MGVEVIAQQFDDTCVFKADNGNIYVVMRDTDAVEPIELVGNTNMFMFGDWSDYDDEPTPYSTVMRFSEAHGVSVDGGMVASILSGDYCKHFKFEGWQDYDYYEDYGCLFVVHKSLGTAEEWFHYSEMWDVNDVWQVIDMANNETVSAIYADSPQTAIELFLNKGDGASLETIVNNARENWRNN